MRHAQVTIKIERVRSTASVEVIDHGTGFVVTNFAGSAVTWGGPAWPSARGVRLEMAIRVAAGQGTRVKVSEP